jgi:hypothetical protein
MSPRFLARLQMRPQRLLDLAHAVAGAVRGPRGLARCGRRHRHVTANPDRITEITRAALVLTQFEHKYIS